MKHKNKKIILLTLITTVLFVSLLSSVIAANIISINKYKTEIALEDDKLIFKKEISLENTGKNTIIPGELHFKLYEILNKELRTIPKISNLVATDKYNNDLSARLITKKGEAEVIISAWQPIMPQFEYNIILKYEIKFKAKGILFHNINIPNEETTIPIKNSETIIKLPRKYSVSYAPNATINKTKTEIIVDWKNVKEKYLEYTSLPFVRTKIHGATIFWLSLITLLSIPLIVILVSELKNK